MARRKKHATLIVMIGRNEKTYRAATVKKALAIATAQIRRAGCKVTLYKTHRLPSGRIAGGEGRYDCPSGVSDGIMWMGLRTNPKGWRRGTASDPYPRGLTRKQRRSR